MSEHYLWRTEEPATAWAVPLMGTSVCAPAEGQKAVQVPG